MAITDKPAKRQHRASITRCLSVCPAPGRMLFVEVFKGDPSSGGAEPPYGVVWSEVFGLLCVVQDDYDATGPNFPGAAPHHEGMVDQGWTMDRYSMMSPQVFALTWADDPSQGLIRVVDEEALDSNSAYRAVVPCSWPPEEDRANATRIAKELISRGNSEHRWISLDEKGDPIDEQPD